VPLVWQVQSRTAADDLDPFAHVGADSIAQQLVPEVGAQRFLYETDSCVFEASPIDVLVQRPVGLRLVLKELTGGLDVTVFVDRL
jgi:hypothetical protein